MFDVVLKRRENRLEPIFHFFVGGDKEFEVNIIEKRTEAIAFETSSSTPTAVKITAEETTLMWLFQEYLSLYKHFDNLRHHFATILILVTAGLSYVPNLRIFAPDTSRMLTLLSTAMIFILAVIGAIANEKLRFRMKNVYNRCNIILEQIFGEDMVKALKKESKRRTALELAKKEHEYEKETSEKKREAMLKVGLDQLDAMEGITRGLIWHAVPWIVGIYAVLFFLFECFSPLPPF